MGKQPPDRPIHLVIPLTLEEVMSIDTILSTYLSFLNGNLSPSRQRDEQKEVATIEAAFIVIGLLIPTMFPRTQDRNVVTESVKQLRQRLFGPRTSAPPALND